MNNQTFSGIDVLGDMTWGTHHCQFYETKIDLLETLVPYFKIGLEKNEFCLWIASDPISVQEATHALKKAVPELDRYLADQKIEILSHESWYLKEGEFNRERVFKGWNEKLNQALEKRFTGMRVSGNVGWIDQGVSKDFIEYEQGVERFLVEKRMVVLCTYPLLKCNASDVLNVAHVHQSTISRRKGQWEIIEIPVVKETKAQIQKINDELEQRVVERKEQLAKANEELKYEIAERKKAEEQKEFEQRDKEALINTTHNLLWSVSSDFKLIAANKAFILAHEAITGVTVKPGDELLLPIAVPGDILFFWKEAYARALSGEAFKKEIYTSAVNKFAANWIEISFNPIYKNGIVVAIACNARDITESRFAEDRLRQSEAHLAEAQRLAKLGSWDFDIKADRLTWSEELYNVFGTDKQTFNETHGSFLHLIDAEDREFAYQTSRHTQQTGEPFTIEYRITTPNGEKRVIREHGYGQKDDNGKVVRLFGTAQDITERKKAEEELHQLNGQLRNLSAHLQNIQENERTAIAREIHDELGQQLTGLKMEVGWLTKKLPEDAVLKEKGNEILSIVSEMLETVKRIASDLRPNVLDELGLIAALEWQAQEFEKHTGISIQFQTDVIDFNFERNLSTNIFRVHQEALTNIARHAEATRIETTLKTKDDWLLLMIKDNGKGFDVDAEKNKNSFGLIGLKERALMLHGELVIESVRRKGTVITLKVPLLKTNKKES